MSSAPSEWGALPALGELGALPALGELGALPVPEVGVVDC